MINIGGIALNTVGTTVGTSHSTVSTPGGYQHFPVNWISYLFKKISIMKDNFLKKNTQL